MLQIVLIKPNVVLNINLNTYTSGAGIGYYSCSQPSSSTGDIFFKNSYGENILHYITRKFGTWLPIFKELVGDETFKALAEDKDKQGNTPIVYLKECEYYDLFYNIEVDLEIN